MPNILSEFLNKCDDVITLALTIWREARGEDAVTRAAVGCSVLNRVQHPKWWGDNIHDVCTARLQYSSMTDPRDPQLPKWPKKKDRDWQECRQLASDILAGQVKNPVPGADSYYDTSIPAPKWATQDCFVGQSGKIRFYNTDHDHEAEVLRAA